MHEYCMFNLSSFVWSPNELLFVWGWVEICWNRRPTTGAYPAWWTNMLLWKITIFNGKIHYKWPFSIAMLVHQRVIYFKIGYHGYPKIRCLERFAVPRFRCRWDQNGQSIFSQNCHVKRGWTFNLYPNYAHLNIACVCKYHVLIRINKKQSSLIMI